MDKTYLQKALENGFTFHVQMTKDSNVYVIGIKQLSTDKTVETPICTDNGFPNIESLLEKSAKLAIDYIECHNETYREDTRPDKLIFPYQPKDTD